MYDNATSLEWGATNPIDLSQHAEFGREQSTSNYKSGNSSPKPLRTGRRVSIFGLSNAVDQQPLIGETRVSTPESVNNESSSNHPSEHSVVESIRNFETGHLWIRNVF